MGQEQQRNHDPTMELLREAGLQLSTIPSIPPSLRGKDESEMVNKLLHLHASMGELLVELAHRSGSSTVLVDLVRREQAVADTVTRLIPDIGLNEALSVALRVAAGCIDSAKIIRVREVVQGASSRGMTAEDRKGDMAILDQRSSQDAVYAAGVSIGPLDKLYRKGEHPVFDGISHPFLKKHFKEYLRRFPLEADHP